METTMTIHTNKPDVEIAPVPQGRLWTGRVMSALPALFLLMDGVIKLVKPEPIVKATVQLGYPESALGSPDQDRTHPEICFGTERTKNYENSCYQPLGEDRTQDCAGTPRAGVLRTRDCV